MAIEKGNHPVVQQISRCDRRLAIVELGASDLGVGVDESLLVDAPNSLQIADIERILGAAVTRTLALELAMGLLLGLGLFQRDQLSLGQHQAVLGALSSRALSRLFMLSRSWRSHTQRTPAGETTSPFFRNSLATRSCPNAGCSRASATIASSTS